MAVATERHRWDGPLCGLVAIVALLLSKPFLEGGLVDDFSYIKTAWVFAQTGHFVYNGWATAMLGWQIPWGALFLKIFGYKVWPLHLSNLVLVAVCIPLLHAVLVRSGLRRAQAALGTLTVALSPIFVPLAVTFMTDVGGLLAIVMCWYACLRALETDDDRARWMWLILAAIVGTVGGTSRQIAWIAALAMVPSAGWLLRRRRGVAALTIGLWIASFCAILASMLWFRHQLFNVPEPIIQGSLGLKRLRELAGTATGGALCGAMLALPLLVAPLPSPTRWKIKPVLLLLLAAFAVTLGAHFLAFHLQERGWMPWTGDIVERLGLLDYPGTWLLGVQPMMFTLHGRMIASFVIVALLLAAIAVLLRSHAHPEAEPHDRVRSWETQIVLLGPFFLGYLCLLLPRAMWFLVLDRYLLPLIPLAALVILRLQQERVSPRLPAGAWVALALLGGFSICGTHDWIASHEARLSAVARLGAAGVPVNHVNAGYEIDGMTQVTLGRAIVDPRVTYPPGEGIGMKAEMPPDLPAQCKGIINIHTPMVHPQFFLSYQDLPPCLGPSRFGAVPYRTWLPPYDRQIAILQRR